MFLFAQPTFAGGMGSVLDIGATLVHYNDLPDPVLADWIAMCQDWAAVGDDLREAMVKELEAMDPDQLERLAQAIERHGRRSLTH